MVDHVLGDLAETRGAANDRYYRPTYVLVRVAERAQGFLYEVNT